mgnify:CR=1 FL=1
MHKDQGRPQHGHKLRGDDRAPKLSAERERHSRKIIDKRPASSGFLSLAVSLFYVLCYLGEQYYARIAALTLATEHLGRKPVFPPLIDELDPTGRFVPSLLSLPTTIDKGPPSSPSYSSSSRSVLTPYFQNGKHFGARLGTFWVHAHLLCRGEAQAVKVALSHHCRTI